MPQEWCHFLNLYSYCVTSFSLLLKFLDFSGGKRHFLFFGCPWHSLFCTGCVCNMHLVTGFPPHDFQPLLCASHTDFDFHLEAYRYCLLDFKWLRDWMTTPERYALHFKLLCHSFDVPLVVRHRPVWLPSQSPAMFQVEGSWEIVPGELHFMIKISTTSFLSKEQKKDRCNLIQTHIKKKNNSKKSYASCQDM